MFLSQKLPELGIALWSRSEQWVILKLMEVMPGLLVQLIELLASVLND